MGVSRRDGGFKQFGFRPCHPRHIAAAIVFGVPIAWALTIVVNHLNSGPPSLEMTFRPWMTILYFGGGDAGGSDIWRSPINHIGTAVSGNAFVFRYFAFLCRDNRCPFVRADPREGESDNSSGGLCVDSQ